ncbi:hypothetical protein GCM10010350_61430 [Streptomyces galilaeus]|nr:hypothetical protein GCM10010350_61430 [Streptomyces galilaeus]
MLPSSYRAAHVPVIVIDRLHETQAVEPENDLWVWHLVGLAEADPLHWPIGIQGDSLSVPRYIADLLKSPFPGKSRVGHLRMISLVSRRSLLQERGWVISGLNCDIARRGSGRLLDCTAPVLTVADPCS